MTRMRLPAEQESFKEADELVEDIRKTRDTHPTGAVSFVNYYSLSQFFYQSTILSNTYYNSTTFIGGVESFEGRQGVLSSASNDYTWAEINVPDDTFGNVSTTKHGLAPKVTDISKFLRGDGTWQTPTDTTGSSGGLAGMYFMASTRTVADVAAITVTGIDGAAGVSVKGQIEMDAAAWVVLKINGYTGTYEQVNLGSDGTNISTSAQNSLPGMTLGLTANGARMGFSAEYWKPSAGENASGVSTTAGTYTAAGYDGTFHSRWTTTTETIRDVTITANTGNIKAGSYFIMYRLV